MEKIKVLACGDFVTKTGFCKVMEGIFTHLPSEQYDISVLAVNYWGDPHRYPFKVYPSLTPKGVQTGDIYGFGRLQEVISREHPDIIFILNDVWVIDEYLQVLKGIFEKGRPRIVVYFPVDAREHTPNWYKNFDIVDTAVAYTQFGKQVAEIAYPNKDFKIIPHGYDPKIFHKLPGTKEELKKAVYSAKPEFYEDSFVVLNANRNQPRKKLWITLEAFKLFSEGKPKNVRLYMHTGIVDQDIDVGALATRFGIDDRLHLSSLNPGPQQVTDERLNQIYNACDVGVNTSLGEGWGLVPFEHAVTGAPQIVPENSANIEVFGDCGLLVPTTMDEIMPNIMTRGSLVKPEDVAERMEWLYQDKGLYTSIATRALNKFSDPKYLWENIAQEWHKVFIDTIIGG
jgi:glycosyltransferase involved in cell wall biosynthesis